MYLENECICAHIYIRMVIKEVLTIEYSKPDYVILASLKMIIVFLIHTYFIE
jgi:hypothetical protein